MVEKKQLETEEPSTRIGIGSENVPVLAEAATVEADFIEHSNANPDEDTRQDVEEV